MNKSELEAEARVNILGVGVSCLNMEEAIELISEAIADRRKEYICVTGVHGIMESQADEELRRIHNRSFLTVPDGMPTVWLGKLNGHWKMGRVYGPDLMLELCQISRERGFKHFLYGGNIGIAKKLKTNLETRFPGIQIVGTYTPPFRPLNEEEENELAEQVAKCQPDCFWVGLSTPKQDRFMASYLERLDSTIMLGVGAAFDIHTGGIRDAPNWMKNSGLQWLHRLSQEPRRLWRRYLINNPIFIFKSLCQLARIKRYEL
jgi:N-acetylglucosaminyldiphosphoundecaprenol N-acetyl-beta-D-mannosaminyltransferase